VYRYVYILGGGMDIKRFLTTSALLLTCSLSFVNVAHAGLFSQPPKKVSRVKHQQHFTQKRVALPQYRLNASSTLPNPSIKVTTSQPIIMASNTKRLPKPDTSTRLPSPTLNHHRHHIHAQPHKIVHLEPPKVDTFYVKSKRPAKARKKVVPHYNTAYLTRVAPFKGISANGNILVVVEQGRFQEVKIMNRSYPGYKLVEPAVIKNVLVLRDVSRKNLKKEAPHVVSVKITTPTLTSIRLRDNAGIRAKNLRSKLLDIDAATTGFVNLRGNIGLHHIYQRGTGPINIEWANSDHIKIISRSSGPIHIAGTTDHLNIRANDMADIDAKHLRSHTGIIQTAGEATVAVTVIDALSGFASELSNIFYYKTPKHLTRHTYDLGNVMQLRYWN